jgi:hypothetical protein
MAHRGPGDGSGPVADAEAGVTLGGRVVRWSVVVSLLVLALVVGRAVPLVGVVVTLLALDAAGWWFGMDSRDTLGRFGLGMPE